MHQHVQIQRCRSPNSSTVMQKPVIINKSLSKTIPEASLVDVLAHLWLAGYTITPSLLRAEVIKVTQMITSPFMSSEWLWVGQVFFKLLLESCLMLDGHCWTSPTSRPSLPLTNTLRHLADHRGVEEKLHCWKCCAFCSGMPWQWNLGKICKKKIGMPRARIQLAYIRWVDVGWKGPKAAKDVHSASQVLEALNGNSLATESLPHEKMIVVAFIRRAAGIIVALFNHIEPSSGIVWVCQLSSCADDSMIGW